VHFLVELQMLRALAIAALFFVSPGLVRAAIFFQDAAASPAKQNPVPAPDPAVAPAPKTPKAKPKKVWTDDNLGEVGGTISVVGVAQSPSKSPPVPPRQAKKTPGQSADGAVDAQTLARFRQELQRQESALAIVDRQLGELKGFSKGDSKNAGGLLADTGQYNSSSVEEQIRHLQETKTKIQATIDNLLDAARASGIEPGQIR
jgi:hypothetical protein